jgi:hypothetical protein
MPNWCTNTLVLEHEDPKMVKRALDAFVAGRFLNEFIPCPQDLIDTVSGYVPEQEALEAQQLANREKYGYPTWYEHNINEWGTKWDVGNDVGINDIKENSIVVYFDSAWAPPIAAYEKLEDLGFKVNAMYNEPGMAFAGKYQDGQDDYYKYGNLSIDEVLAELPKELDETFGITEMMAEYDTEDEE